MYYFLSSSLHKEQINVLQPLNSKNENLTDLNKTFSSDIGQN
jgi:hypothetical protein